MIDVKKFQEGDFIKYGSVFKKNTNKKFIAKVLRVQQGMLSIKLLRGKKTKNGGYATSDLVPLSGDLLENASPVKLTQKELLLFKLEGLI